MPLPYLAVDSRVDPRRRAIPRTDRLRGESLRTDDRRRDHYEGGAGLAPNDRGDPASRSGSRLAFGTCSLARLPTFQRRGSHHRAPVQSDGTVRFRLRDDPVGYRDTHACPDRSPPADGTHQRASNGGEVGLRGGNAGRFHRYARGEAGGGGTLATTSRTLRGMVIRRRCAAQHPRDRRNRGYLVGRRTRGRAGGSGGISHRGFGDPFLGRVIVRGLSGRCSAGRSCDINNRTIRGSNHIE